MHGMKVLATLKTAKNQLKIENLVEDFYDDVWRFCGRRVGVDLASDVTQETFLTVQKSLSRFEGRSSVRTWILGIALNHCREASRKWGRELLSGPMLLEEQVHEDPSIVDKVTLHTALEALSEEHREVVVLHELESLTYEEIAVIAGVPVGTVKSRLHHAFAHLRRILGATETQR
jgi:RNA polymerase sigma-70 factor, ECF subfamily